MKIDLILAFVCSAVSAMSLAFLFVRGMLGTTDGLKRSGSSLRAILAPIALVVEHRRGRDVELSRTLDRLEKLVVQSGGRFMEGATAAEVFAARFVFPLVAFAVVLPLGATINMDGTAIYQGVCSIFIASCFGISLTFPQMLTIVLTATLASIGTAGVPGAGMVMLAMVLSSVGLPVEGIALVAGVDRIFDMGRTTVNITGDASCAIIVSAMEKKKQKA